MTTYIENVLNQFNIKFINNLKIIHVFGHKISEVLILDKDDNVFGFGQNDFGVLGFGHNRQVKEIKIIDELCGKEIINFFNGLYHVIGLTKNGQIYSWGRNNYSQLGNGLRYTRYTKPELNQCLISEIIVDISCGANHSIALTQKKEIYVWGHNNLGQIGNKSDEPYQMIPFKLDLLFRVVSISCGCYHSLALTEKKHVFSWGYNNSGQLGLDENESTYNMFRTKVLKQNEPKLVSIKNDNKTDVFIDKISCGSYHSMLLSTDGEVYTFGDNTFGQIGNNSTINQMTAHKINSSVKYIHIASHFRYNISIALSVKGIFYIWGKIGEEMIKCPKESHWNSINNIFLDYYQITHRSVPFSYDSDKELINFSLLFSSKIIAKFRKPTEIETNFGQNSKISFHFYDYDNEWPYHILGRNTLFVTEEDNVYAIGSNSNGLIGFNNKNEINEPKIVNELSLKGIKSFANGMKHVIARTDGNQLYIWGYNNSGQLGNETYDVSFIPQLIDSLKNECIIDMRCGYWHSLALTEKGEVYAWGQNKFGQIGNKSDNNCQPIPLKVSKFEEQKITEISCGGYHSLALTESGCVYSWGNNEFGQLGFEDIIALNRPKKIKIRNKIYLKFNRISCGPYYSLLLTNEGYIYGFGYNECGQLGNEYFDNHFIPTKIMIDNTFTEIASNINSNMSVALSSGGDYYIWGKCGKQIITEPKATRYNSIDDIFLNYNMISCHKTKISMKYNRNLSIPFEDHRNYVRDFDEYDIIGVGSFGIVSKVKNKNENEIYAIKRITVNHQNEDSVFEEFNIMCQLNSDFVVKVKCVWIESNYLSINGFEKYRNCRNDLSSGHKLFVINNDNLLHVQMELCFETVKNISVQIINELNENPFQNIETLSYSILSEILIEIMECVNYLHKQNPPIIHRDLKPANILITHGINGRFVKLCDFGLSKIHKFEGQSHTKCAGTLKYMAPEVLKGEKYNTSADVYSLGVMIEAQLISLTHQIDTKINIALSEKCTSLCKLAELMKKEQEHRPNCESIIHQKNSWALSIRDVENYTQFEEICSNTFSIEENFCKYFIKKKLENSKH